ncbi:MAG: hypothetical protein IKX88_11395 [Thermoguttaceae bacterium]|nr:hypothetical protein [Thermoguttaceae bacterium]
MGFFKKKDAKKKPRVTNEIENKQLKENIADAALAILTQGEDYQDLVNTIVKFGYLYDVESRGTEALFKVVTDKTTVYFAVQFDKLLRLDFTEEAFNDTVARMKEAHG